MRKTLILAAAICLAIGGPVAAGAEPPPDKPGHSAPGQAKRPAADTTVPQPPSNADFTGHGANTHGPYDSTRDGSPSGNGSGTGKSVGKPCAGCVGKADNKNPPGQLPGPQDGNAGYECDRNHGIGRSNPAHTGCTSTTGPTTPPTTTPTTTTGSTTTTEPTVTTSTTTVSSPGSSTPPAGSPGAPAGRPAPTGALADTGVDAGLPLVLGALLLGLGVLLSVVGRRRKAGTP
ncbi:hypothetical protein GCM10023148_51390 [Actinokineospora soli]